MDLTNPEGLARLVHDETPVVRRDVETRGARVGSVHPGLEQKARLGDMDLASGLHVHGQDGAFEGPEEELLPVGAPAVDASVSMGSKGPPSFREKKVG